LALLDALVGLCQVVIAGESADKEFGIQIAGDAESAGRLIALTVRRLLKRSTESDVSHAQQRLSASE
jgi:hypothetical protein